VETLVFIAGLQQGQRYAIEKDLTRLGRERFNDLTVDDESSSRAHAEIRRKDGVLYLRDLGSTNGTYVNNRRATEVKLSNGDRISIGATVMLVEIKKKKTTVVQPQSVLFHEGTPAEVTTQFRLDPQRDDFLSPTRMRVDVRAQENFKRLYRFMIRMASQLTVSNLLETVMDEIFEVTGADRGFVLLAGEDGSLHPVNIKQRTDRPAIKAAGEITVSKTLSRHVLEKGESLMLTEASHDQRFADTTAFGAGEVLSVIAAPLKVQDKCSGLVYLDTLQGGRLFTQTDQELVTAMSLGAAAALENARLYEQIMDATEYSAAVLRSLSSGLIVTDRELTVGKINRAALEMLGLEEMETVGRRMTELRGASGIAGLMRDALESGRPVDQGEVEISVGDKKLPVGLSVSFMTDHQGRVLGAVANFRDLSQVRKLAEQVKRQEQLAALGEMAAGVAHEIRNPLNSIRGFTQLLGERLGYKDSPPAEGQPGAQEADFLRIIVEEVDRMNNIVQDLLDFARQRQITMTRLSVADVLHTVLRQLEPEAAGLKLEIEEHLDPDLPRAYGNDGKLHQVFMNMARNALQAMEPGGRLIVKTEMVGGEGAPREIAVSFRDNGPGIPADVLPRIFDPFFTTKDVGTGLGLAISAKIIEAHSGRIDVEANPGKGATFTVYLPATRKGKTDRFPAVR